MGDVVRRVAGIAASVALMVGVFTAVQAASPASACACGGMAALRDDPNGDVMINHEYAIISTHGDQEQVDMRLDLDTVATNSGLILPTPAPATVSLGTTDSFAALAAQMTPKVVSVQDWWNPDPSGFGPGSAAVNQPGPTVLATVQLGPLQATTLAASNSAGLTAWLDKNGYGIRPEVTSLLKSYVSRGWYFVAMKLTNNATLKGEIDPIRFTFTTPASGPVYPLALSQAAREAQTVNLYVFGDHRMNVTFADGTQLPPAVDAYPLWAGAVDQKALLAYGGYLTAYTLYFDNPSHQITDDLAFSRASDDDEVGTVVYETDYMDILGIPLGWVCVVGGIVVVALILVGVRRRRSA